MANKEKLPYDLMEEILSRVPPKSLVRFRIVSKRWNALFDDKMFINNHKMTFQFVLATKSKIYTISIDPEIEVHEVTLNNSRLGTQIPESLIDSNGFLLCNMEKGGVVWNPWLEQARFIEPEVNQLNMRLWGIGYDMYKEIVYKTLATYQKESNPNKTFIKVYDFGSDAWKDNELNSGSSSVGRTVSITLICPSVSLNGTLFCVASFDKNDSILILVYFDFSLEQFFIIGNAPCVKNHSRDVIVLRLFRGDRFSLLKQCYVTKKIEIWVTKNNVNEEWVNFMEVSSPDLPHLLHNRSKSHPSYFIDDKRRLVVCSCDETGRACIYVMGKNKLISRIQIDYVVDPWPFHCTYFPSLVSVPRGQREDEAGQREEAETQVYSYYARLLGWLVGWLGS